MIKYDFILSNIVNRPFNASYEISPQKHILRLKDKRERVNNVFRGEYVKQHERPNYTKGFSNTVSYTHILWPT